VKRLKLLGRALIVYGVALALRMRNLRQVLVGDRVLFGYDDPYYHLRRILLTLHEFPKTPAFDAYLNFPAGAAITWPPGFDLLVATVCWIAGFGNPSPHRAEAVAALVIPVLGAAAAVVTLLLAEEILGRGRWEAFGAALLFAFLPAQQAISTVGRLDHHVIEMSAFGCAVLFFLRALRDDPGSRYSFWGGVSLALGIFCWTGSVLFAGFVALFALAQMTLDRLHGRGESSAGRSALRVLFWGSLLLVPLVIVSPGDGRKTITFLLLSWYQPALLALATFLLPALSEIIFAAGRRRAILRASGGALAVTVLVGLAVWILRIGTGGFQFLTRRDRVISLLVESTPVWKLRPGTLVDYFSPLIYVAPVALFFLVRFLIRDRFHDARLNCLLALLLFTAALGVSQARFLNYVAVPYCILLLWAFRLGFDAVQRRFRRPLFRWSWAILAAAIFLAPLAPLLQASVHSLPGNVDPVLARVLPSLEWMRDRTPPTSYYWEPDRKPEYGVLADFTFGHWITAIGQRPNFCNPFSLAPWHEKPIFESARIFLAETGAEASAAMDRNQLRYVLLYNNENALPDYARLINVAPEEYVRVDAATGGASLTPRFYRTFGVKLALSDGSEHEAAGQLIPALDGFRIAHESPETRLRRVPGMAGDIQSSYVKIFERVRGAILEGKIAPGEEIRLRIAVTTNTGRRFEYRSRTAAGGDGVFRLTVPYATESAGEISASPAVLESSACRIEVALSEAEVVAGALHPVRCR
jgi:dolichyl-diphosphooligosaccharide--protein glycosyltransferase